MPGLPPSSKDLPSPSSICGASRPQPTPHPISVGILIIVPHIHTNGLLSSPAHQPSTSESQLHSPHPTFLPVPGCVLRDSSAPSKSLSTFAVLHDPLLSLTVESDSSMFRLLILPRALPEVGEPCIIFDCFNSPSKSDHLSPESRSR